MNNKIYFFFKFIVYNYVFIVNIIENVNKVISE